MHGATGGVGTAAIQLGVGIGARVLATARSDAHHAFLGGLGATVLPDDGFADHVRAATDGAGADVILELVGASHFPANLDALAPRGPIVVVSTASGTDATISLRALMVKRARMVGTVLRTRTLEERAAAIRALEREVVPGLASGRVRPIVDSVYPADDVKSAFDRLAARGKLGKVLLDFRT